MKRTRFEKTTAFETSKNAPSLKVTIAKWEVDTVISTDRRFRKNSIIHLLASIILTGFAALSVETHKYFFTTQSFAISIVPSVLEMFVSIMHIRVYNFFAAYMLKCAGIKNVNIAANAVFLSIDKGTEILATTIQCKSFNPTITYTETNVTH